MTEKRVANPKMVNVERSIANDKKLGELHAYHADNITRTRMLQKLNEIDDLKVLCIILNKKKVHVDLQNQKNYLYN